MPTINNGSGFLKNVTANLWIPRRRPYFLLFNGVLKDKLYTLCKKEKKSKGNIAWSYLSGLNTYKRDKAVGRCALHCQ